MRRTTGSYYIHYAFSGTLLRFSALTQRLVGHEAKRLKRSESAVVEGVHGGDRARSPLSRALASAVTTPAAELGSSARVSMCGRSCRWRRTSVQRSGCWLRPTCGNVSSGWRSANHADHPDEINELADENRQPVEDLRSLYPLVQLAPKPRRLLDANLRHVGLPRRFAKRPSDAQSPSGRCATLSACLFAMIS